MPPLDIEVHLQNNEAACGQACAQMVVRFVEGTLFPQQSYQAPSLAMGGWATTPDQLADMLNQRLPGNARYGVRKLNLWNAMGTLRGAIQQGKPAVAMTHRGAHWVVIRGFSRGQSGSTTVHFWDPVPVLAPSNPNQPPPAIPTHSATDQCFGRNFELAGADELATWSDWTYQFKQCTSTPQNPWAGFFVVVVPDSVGPVTPEPIPILSPPPAGGPGITADRAVPVAYRSLIQAGLSALPNWAETINTVRADLGQAIRIERLDREGAYYLVSLPTPGTRGVLAGIDAYTGELLFARLHPSKTTLKRVFVPLEELRASLPPNAAISRLAWAPSEVTACSPYEPLAEISVPGDMAPQYLRVSDRQLFKYGISMFGRPPG